MTIASLSNKVIYVGDGTQTSYAYTFLALIKTDLTVSTGNANLIALTCDTDYTVTGAGGTEAGGYVILTNALITNSTIVIQRIVPKTQLTDLVENDPMPAESLEKAYDKLTMITQQLQENIDRTVLQEVTWTGSAITFPAGASDYLLGWNAAGTSLENKEPIDATTLSSCYTYFISASTNASAAGSSASVTVTSASAAASSAAIAVAAANIPRVVILKYGNKTDALATGNGVMAFTVPVELHTMHMVSVGAHVYITSSSGKVGALAIYNNTRTCDMLSTNLYIDAAENDSSTCTTAAVINTSYHTIYLADEVQIDADGIGTSANGLEIRMGFSN